MYRSTSTQGVCTPHHSVYVNCQVSRSFPSFSESTERKEHNARERASDMGEMK